MHSTNELNHPTISLYSPVMTQERFAEESGLRVGQVEGQLKRKNLPIHRIGRLVLINLAKLMHDGVSLAIIPLMTYERFALVTGLREAQIISQADLGNIPTTYVGRLRVVDIGKLTSMCLEEAFKTEANEEL